MLVTNSRRKAPDQQAARHTVVAIVLSASLLLLALPAVAAFVGETSVGGCVIFAFVLQRHRQVFGPGVRFNRLRLGCVSTVTGPRGGKYLMEDFCPVAWSIRIGDVTYAVAWFGGRRA